MASKPDYRFASDNTAGLCPEALEALVEANPGRAASYGHDVFSARARAALQQLFETDCEVFFVFNGTAANSVALSALCRRFQSVFCHADAHLEAGECAAPEFFTGGCRLIYVPGAGGKVDPAEFARGLGRGRGVHYPKPGALSLTQSSDRGTLYHPAEIRELSERAHAEGMAVHMDGARFANALAALQEQGKTTAADITWRAGVDVLCFGGTKNGMLTAEAIVIFRKDLAVDFEYRVMQSGQLNSKMRFAAAQWDAVLQDGVWLRHAAHANRMAALLEAELRPLPGVRLLFERETNMIFLDLPPAANDTMQARGWRFFKFVGESGYRLVCGWDTQPEDVREFISDLRQALAAKPG